MATGTTRRTSLNTIHKEGLFWPKITDPDTLSADQHAMARALENDVEGGSGKLSERPIAALRGRLFYVTEGEEKGLWWDTGATWITAAQYIANEAITDAKVFKGRVLVNTENAYVASKPIVQETEYEESSSRPTLVIMYVVIEKVKEAVSGNIYVGGTEISGAYEINMGATEVVRFIASTSFIVPPKVKWRWESVGGAGKQFGRISTLTL